MQDETSQIKIKNKLLEEEVANFENRKEEHRKEILELSNKINELTFANQQFENKLGRKKAQWWTHK